MSYLVMVSGLLWGVLYDGMTATGRTSLCSALSYSLWGDPHVFVAFCPESRHIVIFVPATNPCGRLTPMLRPPPIRRHDPPLPDLPENHLPRFRSHQMRAVPVLLGPRRPV